jgi:hypothetical protein
MKKRKTVVIVIIISAVIFLCALTIGGLFLLVKNNPQIGATAKQLASSVNDMASFQQEILTAFPAESAQIGITNGHILTVSLINIKENPTSNQEKWLKAQEIALFTKNHYSNLDGIDAIDVGIVIQAGTGLLTLNTGSHYVIKMSDIP